MNMQPAIEALNAELQGIRNKLNFAQSRTRELENLIKANSDEIRNLTRGAEVVEAAIKKLSE